MPRGAAERIGAGLGSGLSAFLGERADKDLREEQELQRRNLKALLAAYIDPKTELGSGAMAELMTGVSGIKAQPGQPFGLEPEPEPETYKDIIDRMRIEGLKDLTPDELKKELYGIPLPKPEKEPKRAKDVTGVGSLTAKIKSRLEKTKATQKAYDSKVAYIKKGGSGTDYIPENEKDKRIKELGERPPDYEIPKDISALADSVEAGRIDPEIAAALAGFEPEAGDEELGETFHGATSYEDAEAGLNKNYEAGIISKQDRDDGLIEARQFFGVR